MTRESVSTYVHMKFVLPLYVSGNILDDPTPFASLRIYLMDHLFLNKKTNRNIRISYSLKHSKKILYEKINDSVVWNKPSGDQYYEKPNSKMSVMLFTVATFVKENPCLVTRLVSFDTVKS